MENASQAKTIMQANASRTFLKRDLIFSVPLYAMVAAAHKRLQLGYRPAIRMGGTTSTVSRLLMDVGAADMEVTMEWKFSSA